MGERPLRIFVAMPGTSMGENATYPKPDDVKDNLLAPVVKELRSALGRDVELFIEKDKREAGSIYESMFAEARNADVYIADLTGANPNVYLELGVRWALRDNVTVIICQSVEDLKFNVFANRAILYYPAILVKAQEDIAKAILNGLSGRKIDSPVRLGSPLVEIPREKLDDLGAQIEKLTKDRGDDLLRAAQATEKASERLALLEQALRVNPASTGVLLDMAKTQRALAQYDPAVDTFRKALRLSPNDALLHRELGVTYSKSGRWREAIDSLKDAVRLDPKDAEAWSNLGGAYRRAGMARGPSDFDRESLVQSRECYARAHGINRFDLYAALNVSRLDLLLSKWDETRRQAAKEGFAKQVHLCRFMAGEAPGDFWRRFDLAEALLFSGEREAALETFDEAVALVPGEARADNLASVLGPLENYVSAGVLDEDLSGAVNAIIAKLKIARNPA